MIIVMRVARQKHGYHLINIFINNEKKVSDKKLSSASKKVENSYRKLQNDLYCNNKLIIVLLLQNATKQLLSNSLRQQERDFDDSLNYIASFRLVQDKYQYSVSSGKREDGSKEGRKGRWEGGREVNKEKTLLFWLNPIFFVSKYLLLSNQT